MKSFSFISVTVFAVSSAILSGYAAPLPLGSDVDLEARDECTGLMCARHVADEHAAFLERRANPSATAQKAIDWIKDGKNKASLNTKSLCFYSGSTEVMNTKLKPPKAVRITAHGKLASFMATHGCNSIDNIVSLTGQSGSASKWTTDPDWMQVSKALAEKITGTAYVLLGKTVPATSVWLKEERKALLANAGITKVEVYEIDDKGAIVKKANIKG